MTLRAANSNALAAGAVVLLSLLASGCADMFPSRMNRWNPFRSDDWAAEKKFEGQRPVDRIQLFEQAAAAGIPAAKQADWSVKIAQEFPNEIDPLVRRAMIHVLVKLPTAEASATLKLALKDPNPKVRIAACEAWSSRPAAEAAPVLTEVIGSDSDIDVRLTATRALGKFPQDPAAIRGLGLALDDNDPALQYRAVQSLKAISGRDYGGNIHAWREFAKGNNPPAGSEQGGGWASRWWPSLW